MQKLHQFEFEQAHILGDNTKINFNRKIFKSSHFSASNRWKNEWSLLIHGLDLEFDFFFIKCNVTNRQTALNNSTSGAESEFWANKNSKHFEEIFRNSSLFSTYFVFAQIILEHLSFNFLSDSKSIVYCNTVNTFSAQILLSKKASQRPISGRTKYFFARI